MTRHHVIVRSTHRGLRYVDGRFDALLEPGRYEVPPVKRFLRAPGPRVEIVHVDMRQREFTIKGQEILTADKVAVRVSIITQYRVTDAVAAVERVEGYEDRLYSDVQLAARRSLASMTLEAILTNRNQLSEDILRDVESIATGYGVEILRADVKDLAFPGNLQDIMNRVLAAERLAEAQLVEARTKAEREALEATARADADRVAAQARADTTRLAAEADAAAQRIRADAEVDALNRRSAAAAAYAQHPALLRLRELETLGALSANPAARLYIGFDKHMED
ncbi:slipin family protein [Dactylosporangium sp. AC04546]|uniref:slipin family protein n=1 Tax=Dactylosporangium sp. AC04546 TaxID=2862460 RepID=UPI001EDDF33B|nr:slipin family protein [Dactylosporangium sp. AC04546]WVK87459.1 slipin family protein [Dactylosporangium sp. AC04546]